MIAARRARQQLRSGVACPVLPPCPELPASAGLGVLGVVTRLKPTCLERSFVLQAWMAAHGDARDIVIGVPDTEFGREPAHAWVDGTDAESAGRYLELHRIPATRIEPPPVA
jgi:hypothetical protein